MIKPTWLLLGGSAALLVAAAVYVNIPAEANPADEIDGTPGGTVADLVVLDDDFERWYVAQVTRAQVKGTSLTFTYITGRCEKDGLVGYALDPQSSVTLLTVVAGATGKDCDDSANPHRAEVTLDEPLESEQLVLVKPARG